VTANDFMVALQQGVNLLQSTTNTVSQVVKQVPTVASAKAQATAAAENWLSDLFNPQKWFPK
jgi:hypothetical protein